MELVFEIGCEELPARFVEPALKDLKAAFEEGLADARLDVGEIRLLGTPRRLILLAEDLSERQPDLEEVRTGPPAKIAFDDAGEPTKAALGFARGQGVDPSALYSLETDKGEYLAAKVFEEGAPAKALLPAILQQALEGLRFPKSMRWANLKTNFGRPVRWLLALADGELLPVSFAGVESKALTYGHRFAAPDPFEVKSTDQFLQCLADAGVTVDFETRKQEIRDHLKRLGKEAGGQAVEDPDLVDEVAHLVEAVYAVTLDFDEDYLELPREVLISSMRSHQRYFAIEEPHSKALRPACVVIYNTPVHDPRVVAHGNLKVLRARLDDARFFWDKDLERTLAQHNDGLHDVVWIGELGTMHERSQRMAAVAAEIATLLELSDVEVSAAKSAADLAKADLTTQMVQEFPDLQGVMGAAYARKEGLDEAIARAIEEQYLPDSADGPLPETAPGACVALAEKLDAIVGCFAINAVPTSTSDPYALRRAALGVLRILRDFEYQVSFQALIDAAIAGYQKSALDAKALHAAGDQVFDFLKTRLRFQLTDQFPTDVVQSVLATARPASDVPAIWGLVEALTDLRGEDDFEPLALGFKRVVNILQKQAADVDLDALKVDPGLLKEPAEQALFEAATSARDALQAHLDARRWSEACQVLIGLKAPVDQFFDAVMVMADDEKLRANRLALLAYLQEIFFAVGDISKIQA